MIKRTVSAARNVGIRLKNWRFLKLFLIFVSIKKAYHSDFQRLLRNTKNKRFSRTNDYLPANISCMYAQNSLFVDFIRIYRRGRDVSCSDVAIMPQRLSDCFLQISERDKSSPIQLARTDCFYELLSRTVVKYREDPAFPEARTYEE